MLGGFRIEWLTPHYRKPTQDRGQRCPQLVRQRGQKFVFDAASDFGLSSCFMLSGQKLFALFFGALTPSDIAEDYRVKLLTFHFDLRKGSFNGKFLAIRPHSRERSERAHRPPGHARPAKRTNLFTVLWNEAIDRLTYSRGSRTAKHSFGGGIKYGDPLILIDSDDRIHGRTNHVGKLGLAFAQRLLELFAFGDVPT